MHFGFFNTNNRRTISDNELTNHIPLRPGIHAPYVPDENAPNPIITWLDRTTLHVAQAIYYSSNSSANTALLMRNNSFISFTCASVRPSLKRSM
jgi:hypothetical protein